METPASHSPSRRGRWVFGLICFGLGMAAMWGLQQVDVRALLRSGASTEDELARAAFEALSDGDFEDFDAHVPKLADFEAYIARIREKGTDRDRKRVDRKLREEGGMRRAVEDGRAKIRTSFADTIDRARREGLDWRSAEYGGLNHERTRIRERYGWRGGDIHFYVRAGKQTFEFELDGCLCLDGTWMVGNRVRMVRPYDGPTFAAPATAPTAVPDEAVPPAAVEQAPERTTSPDPVEEAVSEAADSPRPPRADSPPKRQR